MDSPDVGHKPSCDPKPLQLPTCPHDFPINSWPLAVWLLSRLIHHFQNQSALREFCEQVVLSMVPIYSDAVEKRKIKPGDVLADERGMGELLRLVLAANDPGPNVAGRLSDEANRIMLEVRTATWWRVAEGIAEHRASVSGTRVSSGPMGRPRKDEVRELIHALKIKGHTWKEIAKIVSADTGRETNAEACRSLLKARQPGQNSVGKKGQK